MTRFPTLALKSVGVMIREARITDNENVKKINAWKDGLREVETLTGVAAERSQSAESRAEEAKSDAQAALQYNVGKYLAPVDTFANLSSAHPSPAANDRVFVRDTGKVYVFTNGDWFEFSEITAGPVNELESRVQEGLASTNAQVNEAERATAESNARRFLPNAARALNIPTYDGSNQPTHPSIEYFPNGWNGYKYWLAFTPYPGAQVELENPSVVASNDNETWEEPAANPIVPLPAGAEYQSDPHLCMQGDTMELWYRVTDGSLTEIYRVTTTDGVNWSAREKLTDNSVYEMVRSPAVRYIDGKYRMWYTSDNDVFKYAESTDGKTWEGTRALNIDLDPEYYFWHHDVIVTNGLYEIFAHCYEVNGEGSAIFYTRSRDNQSFSVPARIMLPTIGSSNIDNLNLYRPAVTRVGNEYWMYYGTIQRGAVYQIAFTKGFSPLAFAPAHELLYPAQVLISENNKYFATDSYTVFPKNAITYTKIYDTANGFPVRSGTLVTDTVFPEAGRARQTFYEQASKVFYVRHTDTNGAWSTFIPQNQRVAKSPGVKSVPGATIEGAGSYGVDINISGVPADAAVIGNPSSDLEPGLFFNVTVRAANYVQIKVFNFRDTTTEMATRNWNFTIIEKGVV